MERSFLLLIYNSVLVKIVRFGHLLDEDLAINGIDSPFLADCEIEAKLSWVEALSEQRSIGKKNLSGDG